MHFSGKFSRFIVYFIYNSFYNKKNEVLLTNFAFSAIVKQNKKSLIVFEICMHLLGAFWKGREQQVNSMGFKFQFENPYNVLAEWIYHLRELDQTLFSASDLRKTMQLPDDLETEVNRLFQSFPHIGNRDCKSLALRFGIPLDEKQAVQHWEHYGDFFYMLRLLSLYTEQMVCDEILSSPYFFSITHGEDGTSREFESLNTNVEETGFLIIPKVRTINDPLDPADEGDTDVSPSNPLNQVEERGRTDVLPEATMPEKHWATDRIDGIQPELSHVFYVETEKLWYKGHRYHIRNSFLSRHMFPENKKVFRIAVCPVVREDLLNIKTYCEKSGERNQRRCSVEGLKSRKLVHDKLYTAILRAGEERADVFLCSEMLGDETVISLSFFESVQKELHSREYPMPGLTLLPTWWHNYCNELYVRDSSGKLLCVQQKQTPYPHKDEKSNELYAEDLRNPERVVHMVHIPDVGRMTFPICKDFLEEDYIRIMLRQLQATFLLCPSYSPAKTQFDLSAPGAIPYGCYTVWCNTCAAYYKSEHLPEHIGLAAGPQDPAEGMCLLVPKCGENCGDGVTPCIFLVEISMDRSAKITYSHIYK